MMEQSRIEACAGLVERGDPDRFLAAMAAPVAARGPLFTLYAFNLEVARAPWVTQEPLIARMRLQFWRDVVEGAVAGERAQAHDVAGPLAALIKERGLPGFLFDQMIDARETDIEHVPFADTMALWDYLEGTSGALMALAVRALGGRADSVARDCGAAQGLANYLMAIPALEAAGRRPVPDGRAAAISELAGEGLLRLERARQESGKIAPPARPALLAAWRARSILAQAAAHPGRVGAGMLTQSEFARRGSLLWRSLTGPL